MQFKSTLPNYLPSLVSVLLVLLAVLISAHYQKQLIQAELEHEQQKLIQILAKAEELHGEQLSSISRFFASSDFVSRDEFKLFVDPILQSYNSIQALEWVPQVADEERSIFEDNARRDGFALFQIKRWQPSVGWIVQSESWARN